VQTTFGLCAKKNSVPRCKQKEVGGGGRIKYRLSEQRATVCERRNDYSDGGSKCGGDEKWYLDAGGRDRTERRALFRSRRA
jgi:hypothetical protein